MTFAQYADIWIAFKFKKLGLDNIHKYGDDRVFVKIDDENKTNKTYQTCLYSFNYNLSKGAYDFNKKDCVIYKDYIINQDLYNKTYGLNK